MKLELRMRSCKCMCLENVDVVDEVIEKDGERRLLALTRGSWKQQLKL